LVALFFVYRSFYGMRIPERAVPETAESLTAPAESDLDGMPFRQV
jgi:hypothetical protein